MTMKAILTDGAEVFAVSEINALEELDELNQKAKQATDGNLQWVAVPEQQQQQG